MDSVEIGVVGRSITGSYIHWIPVWLTETTNGTTVPSGNRGRGVLCSDTVFFEPNSSSSGSVLSQNSSSTDWKSAPSRGTCAKESTESA